MIDIDYKKIIRVTTIALTLFVSVFVAAGSYAQTNVDIPVDGGDPDIDITALVRGCGNGIIEPDLGEQCEGGRNASTVPLDLNGVSCFDRGFNRGGTLSCRNSCIFNTDACIQNSGSRRDPSRVRDNNEEVSVPNTNVVFTGRGEPNSTFFAITSDGIFTKVKIDPDGKFSVTISEPIPGEYNFTFYTLSPNGLFGPRTFSTPIQQYATTHINNIFIPYEIEEEIIEPIVPVDKIDPTLPLNPNLGTRDQNIDGDLYKQFLDILAKSENLSPNELSDLIRVFSEQNGYTAEVPGYSKEGFKIGLLPYLQHQWSLLPSVGRKWYPNVYLSFLTPYRIFFYEFTDWFRELNNPVTNWLY